MDVLTVAPKKANWDLKRDVEKRLATLDRRTQRALRDIIRASHRNAEGGADVAAAVAQHEAADDADDADSD